MSAQATSAVLNHSQARLGARLVLLAIADHAHPDGTGADPGLERIARFAHVSVRQVQRAIKDLMEMEELTVEWGGGRHNTNHYVLRLPGLIKGDNLSPLVGAPQESVKGDKSGPEMSPEPKGTKSTPNTSSKNQEEVLAASGSKSLSNGHRKLNLQERKADQDLNEQIVPVLRAGGAYDARLEFARTWKRGWEECAEANLNPTPYARHLTMRFVELLGRDLKPSEQKALAALVGSYGMETLNGISSALTRSLEGNWIAYAAGVCKGMQRERRAGRAS